MTPRDAGRVGTVHESLLSRWAMGMDVTSLLAFGKMFQDSRHEISRKVQLKLDSIRHTGQHVQRDCFMRCAARCP